MYSTSAQVSGPQASVYFPAFDKGKKVFKGGKRQGSSDPTCKNRNTRIYVTALGGLNVTVPTSVFNQTARVLQAVPTTPTYSVQVTVQSDYWSTAFMTRLSAIAMMACAAIALLAF